MFSNGVISIKPNEDSEWQDIGNAELNFKTSEGVKLFSIETKPKPIALNVEIKNKKPFRRLFGIKTVPLLHGLGYE